MVLLFVICGWREEAARGGSVSIYVLGTFYIRFFMYQGYESRKNCKPSCVLLEVDLAGSQSRLALGT